MKKSVKQIILGAIITVSTLVVGFGITMLSFHLFDTLTSNQMKILFTIDILSLAAAATGVWYFFDSKKSKAKREKEFMERHNKRIQQRQNEINDINKLINFSNFAA